jgi:hypothetical protein
VRPALALFLIPTSSGFSQSQILRNHHCVFTIQCGRIANQQYVRGEKAESCAFVISGREREQ